MAKQNEIEKIITEAIGNEEIGDRETEKWLRRKLRALVRKACERGQHMQFRVQNEKESWVEHYQKFKDEFGVKL